MRHHPRPWLIALSLVTAAGLAAAGVQQEAGQAPRLEVRPENVAVGMLYSGCEVHIEATLPACDGVVVVVAGKGAPLHLKRLGKVWGLFWMNVGEVSFEDVPALYLIESSGKLCELASCDVRKKLGVGYEALSERVAGSSGEATRQGLFDELVKLKEKEKLFGVHEGTVDVGKKAEGLIQASTTCWLPARTPAGTYRVEVWGFSHGEGALLASGSLAIAEAGMVRAIANIAHERGLLFGVSAVVIAIIVGLLTGIVFGLGSKKGH